MFGIFRKDIRKVEANPVDNTHMEEISESSEFPKLESINVDLALKRLGGNRAFLKKLIFEFIDGYSDQIDEMQDIVEVGNDEDVYRLVHAITELQEI